MPGDCFSVNLAVGFRLFVLIRGSSLGQVQKSTIHELTRINTKRRIPPPDTDIHLEDPLMLCVDQYARVNSAGNSFSIQRIPHRCVPIEETFYVYPPLPQASPCWAVRHLTLTPRPCSQTNQRRFDGYTA